MMRFTSLSDLDQLTDDDPAKPVVKQLLEWLIAENEWPDYPYNADDHGYIALVEPDDIDRELDDINMPRLSEILWEGVSIIDGYYHAVYLGAGDFGIGFVIPVNAPWLSDELRELLESLVDDPNASSLRFTT
jgi:hypothetical protein